MNVDYKNIDQLIALIDGSNREHCASIIRDNFDRFHEAPGSLSKHQAWKGGYIDHLEETMNYAINLYNMMNGFRELPFTISDAILVLFLHDLEKPFRYVEPKLDLSTEVDKKRFVNGLIEKYGISLTNDQMNSLKYIHGEGDDYSRTVNVQGPLAAFVHMCDTVSARIWFDYPKHE